MPWELRCFVGIHTANETVRRTFADTVDRVAGRTELQMTAGEAAFGEDVLERVQSAETVRVAVPVIEAVVDSNIPGLGSLLVLGIDMTGDRSLRDLQFEDGEEAILDDPLVFLAQADSLIITRAFADRSRLSPGSRLPLATSAGGKIFTVRGIMKASGLASAFGGNLALMDIYAAQRMFGRGRTFDRIDLAVKPGATLAECQRELSTPAGTGIRDPSPSGSRAAVRSDAGRILPDAGPLQRVRARGRRVHRRGRAPPHNCRRRRRRESRRSDP
jgi:putative ABC transport system permease protein